MMRLFKLFDLFLLLSEAAQPQRHPSEGWDPFRRKFLEEVIYLLGGVKGFIINWIPAFAGMTRVERLLCTTSGLLMPFARMTKGESNLYNNLV